MLKLMFRNLVKLVEWELMKSRMQCRQEKNNNEGAE